MDRDLVSGLPEGPGNPMRFSLIGRVETDEKLLSHQGLPGGMSGLLIDQLPQTVVVSLDR
jgi:hypothetical protein